MCVCSKGTEPEQVVHALSIVQDPLNERVWLSKSQSSLLNVYFLCPLFYLFTPAPVRMPVHNQCTNSSPESFSRMFK